MQTFKVGDRVNILPRYAHFYPSSTAVITEVKPDTYRPLFNDYKIEFADGSTADIFEFQIRKAED